MKDINELIAKLKMELNKKDKEKVFETVIKEIETFYKENLFLDDYEVAIFLTNKEKTILSFACPEYLVNSGLIPVSSTETYTASIYRSGRSIIENNFQHLPFSPRWIANKKLIPKPRINRTIESFLGKNILMKYPILLEKRRAPVAQEEHTIVIDMDGKKVVTTKE